MNLFLNRTYLPNGTNGMLLYNGKLLCYSIELPWRSNEPRRSCIPEGSYRLTLRQSAKFKKHLLVNDVPGRSLILIHPANDAQKELQGCIAPVTLLTAEGKGSYSRSALAVILALVKRLPEDEHVFLTIQSNQL